MIVHFDDQFQTRNTLNIHNAYKHVIFKYKYFKIYFLVFRLKNYKVVILKSEHNIILNVLLPINNVLKHLIMYFFILLYSK